MSTRSKNVGGLGVGIVLIRLLRFVDCEKRVTVQNVAFLLLIWRWRLFGYPGPATNQALFRFIEAPVLSGSRTLD